MSDYGDYDDYQQYEEPENEMQEENIETTLEFDNYQAEELFREKRFQQALHAFQEIYNKANQHNVRSWKAKALTQLLEMHVIMGNDEETRNTLHKIRQMNEVDKTSEQAVKNIIKTLNSVQKNVYESFWDDIFALIRSLDDPSAQLKCYFLMFEKQIQAKNSQKSKQLYGIINNLAAKVPQLTPSLELQMLYLQILYLKLQNLDFKSKLTNLYIKLPRFEEDTNVNEAYLSKIKEEIAGTLYSEENFAECTNFLCGCFIQNSKYGSNAEKNKQLLKINTLMIFLCGQIELLEDAEFNPLLHESTSVFKVDTDIQALYGLISAFKALDVNEFEEVMKVVDLNLPKTSPYSDLQIKVILELKKQKIVSICKSYRTIKFGYLSRRINENDEKRISQILFSLITSNKIHGVIHLKDKYLEILPEENRYYTIQLQNLHDLTTRM